MPNKKISIPQSPKQQEKKERSERIKQRQESKKTNYTNAEVMAAINDLHAEIRDLLKK